MTDTARRMMEGPMAKYGSDEHRGEHDEIQGLCKFYRCTPITNQEESEKPDVKVGDEGISGWPKIQPTGWAGYTEPSDHDHDDQATDGGPNGYYWKPRAEELEAEITSLKAKLNAALESASISESARLNAEAERDRLISRGNDVAAALSAVMDSGEPIDGEGIDHCNYVIGKWVEALSPSPTVAPSAGAPLS